MNLTALFCLIGVISFWLGSGVVALSLGHWIVAAALVVAPVAVVALR